MIYFLKSNVYLKAFNLSFSKKLKEYAACEMKSAMKKIKARKKGKRKWKRDTGILLYVTAFIVIITLSVLYQRNSQPPPVSKKPANEYFSFSKGSALAESLDPQNDSILISQAGFTITAVEGNATNVIINPLQGNVALEDSPHFYKIIQGEAVDVGPIMYQNRVPSEKQDQGWPLSFRISCNEAEGEVTVYIEMFVPLNS
jgi:hypothetical protein